MSNNDNFFEFEDNYRDFIGDNFSNNDRSKRPKGKVFIYEIDDDGNKKEIFRNNIIVYQGRELMAQRIVNRNNDNINISKDEWIQWFGLGEGGVDPSDPLTPIDPVIDDKDLYSPIMISDTTASEYADFHTVGEVRPSDGFVYSKTGFYKKKFDQSTDNKIEFLSDIVNDDSYLIVKITTTIDGSDAMGEKISEAGLFSAASDSGGYNGNFNLFARVTFPTNIKPNERRLIFIWYLFF